VQDLQDLFLTPFTLRKNISNFVKKENSLNGAWSGIGPAGPAKWPKINVYRLIFAQNEGPANKIFKKNLWMLVFLQNQLQSRSCKGAKMAPKRLYFL
jgi:hypothetical protein